jgi:hypothetical protein
MATTQTEMCVFEDEEEEWHSRPSPYKPRADNKQVQRNASNKNYFN